MADKRKLQGEMERCFKKIVEGVETFEDIWDKLHSATNTNQKDKYESDLKKEIKKLQRLRDQIKTWAASNEIKDKDQLLQYRRLIEQQMEKFKIVERETKTKAYSKEGLGLAAKVDPAQKEREETQSWLQSMISELNCKVDISEGDIEALQGGSRKKKIDPNKAARISELENIIKNHSFHIQNLECLLRMLDNETVECQKVKLLKDDLEYYMESCEDDDYEHNEFLYTDMGLDESALASSVQAVAQVAASPTDSYLTNQAGGDDESLSSKMETSGKEEDTSTTTSSSSRTTSTSSKRGSKTEETLTPRKLQQQQRASAGSAQQKLPAVNSSVQKLLLSSSSKAPQAATPQASAHLVNANQPYAAAAAAHQTGGGNHQSEINFKPAKLQQQAAVQQQQQVQQPPNMWLINNLQQQQATTTPTPQPQQQATTVVQQQHAPAEEVRSAVNSIVSSVEQMSVRPSAADSNGKMQETTMLTSSMNGLLSQQQQLTQQQQQMMFDERNRLMEKNRIQTIATSGMTDHPIGGNNSTAFERGTDLSALVKQQDQQQFAESRITPLQGVAPLGTQAFTKEVQWHQMLSDACYRHMPHPSDSERQRHYLPRNPCQTPKYYPQTPVPHHDALEFYLRLSTESLFFIFYYMEASKAQFMAAKALKKQSWRFHTKYMMWFQRHEEPKIINDEFEQGTYIYFDYERWGQRKKEQFIFEYRFLEDRELQ